MVGVLRVGIARGISQRLLGFPVVQKHRVFLEDGLRVLSELTDLPGNKLPSPAPNPRPNRAARP